MLDGLGAHRTARVRELVEERGAELLFLPSYSPDLNPIEEAFSKIKNIVRKAGARTREALEEVTGEALSAVTLEDSAGWFLHCGYESGDQFSLTPLYRSGVCDEVCRRQAFNESKELIPDC